MLAAAALAGVDRILRVGGAQAVGALAFGTATRARRSTRSSGPGNAYVAAAKRRVFGRVGIDMVAGPSEVLVIADCERQPRLGRDGPLLAGRARRDRAGDPALARRGACSSASPRRCAASSRRCRGARIIAASLAARGALIRVRDLDEACEIANRIAPEHLELAVADPEALLPTIRHAGAIFLGHHASESLGDYCAGPNHVLPTSRTARFSSPLGVYDFQKRSSVIARVAARARATSGAWPRRSRAPRGSRRTRAAPSCASASRE